MKYDQLTTIQGSMIYHGHYNNRIYLMKFQSQESGLLLQHLNELAEVEGYSKIIAKVPRNLISYFGNDGYKLEAVIPLYFNGINDLVFMSKFLKPERVIEYDKDAYEGIIKLALSKQNQMVSQLNTGLCPYTLQELNSEYVESMADIYARVFKSYPFPIFEADYLKQTMRKNFRYFGAFDSDKLVAVSSCEMYPEQEAVEMTDFATLSEFRGKNIALFLLGKMEQEMRRAGFRIAYTIARASSAGMNITFAKNGYQYSGRLVNNTNIAGALESMNIWYRTLL